MCILMSIKKVQEGKDMNEYDNNRFKYTSGQNPGQFQSDQEPVSSPLIETSDSFDSDRRYSHSSYQNSFYQQEPQQEHQWEHISGFRRNSGKMKKSRRKEIHLTRGGITALILVCILFSSAFGFGGAFFADQYFDNDTSKNSSSLNANTTGFNLEDATGSSLTVQEITKKAQNSVVEIRTETVGSDVWMQQYVTEGAGSGVIIKSNGYIVTNNHVIADSNKIYVTTKDEKEYEAELVGSDEDADIAILKINAKNLQAATMGNSDQLNIGDLAVAIGNPLGELGGTVTAGIISALDRSIALDGKTMTLLQTDTSINPGNSGGGLFNQYGQLIGIVVAKSSGSDVEGLGFAIPINKAADIADQLIENGYVKGGVSTGMTYTIPSQEQRFGSFFGGDMQQEQGNVYIYSVDSANAKKAGFKAGDMVYSVDGKEIDSFETLSSIITSHKVGDKLKYVVVRDYEKIELTLTLGEKKPEKTSKNASSQ